MLQFNYILELSPNPDPKRNLFLNQLNQLASLLFGPHLRMVTLNDIAQTNRKSFYDELNPHPELSRIMMDRIWNVVVKAREERERGLLHG